MELTYNNLTINLPESFVDLTLGQYLTYLEIYPNIKENDNSVDNQILTFKLIETLAGITEDEMDEMSINDMNDLSIKIVELVKTFNMEATPSRHFRIGDVDYSYNDMNDLTNGEYISLNIIREQVTNYKDLIKKLAAILIRPATMEYDKEAQKEVWTIEKFNKRDIQNLDLRGDIFYNKAKAIDIMPIVTFFLTMK